MRRTKYYRSKHHLDTNYPPYVIAKGELFTPYEIQKYKLQKLITSGTIEEVTVKNGIYFWFGFRFEKEAE